MLRKKLRPRHHLLQVLSRLRHSSVRKMGKVKGNISGKPRAVHQTVVDVVVGGADGNAIQRSAGAVDSITRMRPGSVEVLRVANLSRNRGPGLLLESSQFHHRSRQG
jgi:hypothetical protein